MNAETLAWLADERRYADRKLAEMQMALPSIVNDPGYWFDDIDRYLHRAELLGLESPLGRQALGKAIVVALRTLEEATAVLGPLPPGGLPSGHRAG